MCICIKSFIIIYYVFALKIGNNKPVPIRVGHPNGEVLVVKISNRVNEI